jgi:hypothetical protein
VACAPRYRKGKAVMVLGLPRSPQVPSHMQMTRHNQEKTIAAATHMGEGVR